MALFQNFWFFVVLGGTILVPAVISLFRPPLWKGEFLPFFLFLWAGTVHEGVKLQLVLHGRDHSGVTNVFALVQALLLVWQFRRWELFGRNRVVFWLAETALVAAWAATERWCPRPEGFNTVFLFLSAMAVALMALSVIGRQVVRGPVPLWRNPVFIAGAGLALNAAFSSMVEIFWWVGLDETPAVQLRIQLYSAFMDLGCHAVYLTAILCIPKRRNYYWPFS